MASTTDHPGPAARLAATVALLLAAAAADASTVLFENYDPDAPFSPTTGLNIWSACSGRAMPFTVTEAGYATVVQFPLGNWGVADRGNLVVELMLDYGAAVPGYVSAPNPDALLATTTEIVTDWAGTHERRFSIAFAAPVRLDPGVVYWLGVSLDKPVPAGVPGLTWWGNTRGETGPTAARSGMPPGEFWYPSRFESTNALRVVGTSVVPLPAAGWLLLSALGSCALRARRGRQGAPPARILAAGVAPPPA
jgi:hypothetical protein